MNRALAYARTQAETATKEQMMVLLFRTALKHMRSGAAALEASQPAEAVRTLTKATDIVLELSATLDTNRAPELCNNLAAIYEFVSLQLTRAVASRDAKAARAAEKAFAPIAEGFDSAVSAAAGGASARP